MSTHHPPRLPLALPVQSVIHLPRAITLSFSVSPAVPHSVTKLNTLAQQLSKKKVMFSIRMEIGRNYHSVDFNFKDNKSLSLRTAILKQMSLK